MSKKILVVGDSMLDVRIDCEVTRISPEAPIPIYDVDHEQCYAGGAANFFWFLSGFKYGRRRFEHRVQCRNRRRFWG